MRLSHKRAKFYLIRDVNPSHTSQKTSCTVCVVSYSECMATRKIIESDLTGEEQASTVTFGMGDTWYEIDLTDDERAEFEGFLNKYRDAGREKEIIPEKKKVVPVTSREERRQIREWARARGFDFAVHGRIPKHVQRAYDEAHDIKRDDAM